MDVVCRTATEDLENAPNTPIGAKLSQHTPNENAPFLRLPSTAILAQNFPPPVSGNRQIHSKTSRQVSCPDQYLGYTENIGCSTPTQLTNCSSQQAANNSGKRFARRAKRWAELQQRRQTQRRQDSGGGTTVATTTSTTTTFGAAPDVPPLVYEYVEMKRMGYGVFETSLPNNFVAEQSTTNLTLNGSNTISGERRHQTARRSLSYSIFQPRRHEIPLYYSTTSAGNSSCSGASSGSAGGGQSGASAQVYMSKSVNEYGHPTLISVYRTPPLLTVYPRLQPPATTTPVSQAVRYSNSMSPSESSSSDALSLVTSELSATGISSPNSSPLNTSTSSQDNDEYFVYPNPTMPQAANSVRSINYSSLHQGNMQLFPNSLILNQINTAPPPERNWVMIRHADPDRPIATFTVLCYNVLCDKYATVSQYSYCPSWALNWEYRKQSIIKEIKNYEADIITLQEVETEQYRLLFLPELKGMGYTGIFSPKSRAKTMSEEERKYVDGCAIFWKSDKFEMDRQHTIEFTQLAMKKGSMSDTMLNRVMPKDNIALCAVLKIKENVYANRRMSINANDNVVGSPLVVCTAHIHWDPEFCDVKLVQTMMLAHEVHRVAKETAEKYRIQPQQTPVLICGDLNSLPDSGVFEFLSQGQLSRKHPDLKTFREDACLERFSSSDDSNVLTHALRLDSAVDTSSIPFTNYTLDFKGMIDYIFSTPQSLARLGILGSFDSNWVTNNKILGFPHPHVPSDHIPIMAQYAIIPTTHQRTPPRPQAVANTANSTQAASASSSHSQLTFSR